MSKTLKDYILEGGIKGKFFEIEDIEGGEFYFEVKDICGMMVFI